MATGGTLPFKKEQSISLYNTTGIIERDKNIYFCPFITSSASKIKEKWLTLFKAQCSSPTDYTDIVISKWSPEDRKLVVKGNVDDFRLVSEFGNALNYLVLTRKVYDTENTYSTYYYAFFITDVKQSGQGSVYLSLEPDHFTNVFYLHNEEVFSGTGYYDPFNGKMKNNYVARQHYDRVKLVELTDVVYNEVNPTFIEYTEDTLKGIVFDISSTVANYDWYKFKALNKLTGDITIDGRIHIIDRHHDIEKMQLVSEVVGGVRKDYLKILFNVSAERVVEIHIDEVTLTVTPYKAQEDNLPIFSQIEESFKYKRQFRDYKQWLNGGNPFTKEELETIQNTDSFSDLSSDLKTKCYKYCLNYINLVLSDSKCLLKNNDYTSSGLEDIRGESKFLNNTLPFIIVSAVLVEVPDFLYKYKNSMNLSVPVYYGSSGSYTRLKKKAINEYFSDEDVSLATLSDVSNFLNSEFASYVISVFFTKEAINKETTNYKLEVSASGYRYICGDGLPLASREVCGFLPVTSSFAWRVNQQNHTLTISYSTHDVTTGAVYFERSSGYVIAGGTGSSNDYLSAEMFLISNIDMKNYNINLLHEIKDVRENYFDSILNFSPYSFYTLSYLGNTEVVLQRKNYYETDSAKLDFLISCDGVLKYTVIPNYSIEGKYVKFFNESLFVTSTSSMLFKTTALDEYLIANRTQMKNQFAVIEESYGYDVLKGTVSGTEKIITGGLKGYSSSGTVGGAGLGASAGLVSGVSNLIQDRISYEQSKSILEMNQKAKLGDLGNQPSAVKQLGTDIFSDYATKELGVFLNHYRIDEVSYNSICKYLERFGYMVNIYDSLHVNSRVGWDYVQLASFDYEAVINIQQEESIRQIFAEGVTLLHDKNVLTSGHNYETILKEVVINE